ncbi:MAG: LapA family protein [Deinococcus sp.]|nr:LapA family protein [Deinococcus sp.]
MKLLNWLAFLITLLVAGLSGLLYVADPLLLLGTPWGSVHLAWLVAGAFLLGAMVAGFYVMAYWFSVRKALGQRLREIKRMRADLEALKQKHVEEIPRIPDRPEA